MHENRLYPNPTQRSGYRYLLTTKHHGAGSSTDACWASDITPNEEFQVFDDCDTHQILDDGGWMYGVLKHGDSLRELGTWQQQVAAFPYAEPPSAWHGYPLWAVNFSAPDNRRGEQMRPAKAVFMRMEAVCLITTRQRKRLMKGDHV